MDLNKSPRENLLHLHKFDACEEHALTVAGGHKRKWFQGSIIFRK